MTSPVDAVIERLRSENLCHRNDLTGCEIWTGDFDRRQRPQYGNVQARDYMFQAASGDIVRRGEEVVLACENPRCILPAHMSKKVTNGKPVEPLPEADVAAVDEEYFELGSRIDYIAEKHNWSKGYTLKLVAEARSRRGKSE